MNDLITNDLMAELAAAAKQEVSNEPASSSVYLSARGKRWRIGDEKLPDQLDVVVILAGYEKAYYDNVYSPDSKSPPACFALALSEDKLVPHEVSPNKQSSSCVGCRMNEYETAQQGKGKACKDARRMVLVAYGADGMATSQLAQFKLPPTSLKAWTAYVRQVSLKTSMPTFAVVTTMSFNDDFDYPVIEFNMKKVLSNEDEIRTAMSLKPIAEQMVLRPYNVDDYVAPSASAASGQKSKMS